ncbi:MAG TPA: hypothetical protein VM261_13490 [Kofleriaceae bacterium]|nr:hypothetical protein [Kofleriaceae bacterium]
MKDQRPPKSKLTGEARLAAERDHAREVGIPFNLFAGQPLSASIPTMIVPPGAAACAPAAHEILMARSVRDNPLRPLPAASVLKKQLELELERHAAGDVTMAERVRETYAALAAQSKRADLTSLRRAVVAATLGIDPGDHDDCASERNPSGTRSMR